MSRVEGLKKEFDEFTIDIPSWDIADQGVTALWGPSGSGKTTVFRMLIGLEECPSLSWRMAGEDLATLPVPERRLGVVFQTLELFPHMTARENIEFAARSRALTSGDTAKAMTTLVEDLRLDSFLERPARLLSVGEAQRVALARALIGRPHFLFLDEPFSALDAELKADARRMVKSVITKAAIPTLLITHDEADLSVLADHVVKIKNGRLV